MSCVQNRKKLETSRACWNLWYLKSDLTQVPSVFFLTELPSPMYPFNISAMLSPMAPIADSLWYSFFSFLWFFANSIPVLRSLTTHPPNPIRWLTFILHRFYRSLTLFLPLNLLLGFDRREVIAGKALCNGRERERERESSLELGIMEEREKTGKQWNVGPNNSNKIWVESGFELAIESQNSPSIIFKFGMGPI